MGKYAYVNLLHNCCARRISSDGEGIIIYILDGRQVRISQYTAQEVAYNNIIVNNGAKGIEVNDNSAGSNHSTIWFNQNTVWGDLTDTNQSWLGCGEISLYKASNTHVSNNLVSTKGATGCGGHPIYALAVSTSDGSD